jgi:microsomal epoxide hydrolase
MVATYDVRPFRIEVPESVLTDLRQRLSNTRLPDVPPVEPWSTGTSVAYLKRLIDYWRDGFDWRAQEAGLNAFRQYTVPLGGIDLHFIHEPGRGPDPMPLLLVHGWPGSVVEFHTLLPMLTDPARFGADPDDAFTVVAPSLPGYAFSFRPGQKRFSVEEMAEALAALMTDVLGFRRSGAQGGDWGSFVSSRLGYEFAERLIGIHLNFLAVRRDPANLLDATPEEKAFRDQLVDFLREETGYQWIQGTKPTPWPLGSPTPRPVSLHGWWRNSDRGPTAAETPKRCSRATRCSPTSWCIGSPGPSAAHSGRTTPACTGRGPFRRGAP